MFAHHGLLPTENPQERPKPSTPRERERDHTYWNGFHPFAESSLPRAFSRAFQGSGRVPASGLDHLPFPRGQFSDLGTLLLLLLPLPETTALKKADDSEIHSCSLNTGSMGQEEVSTSKAPPAQTFERVPKGPN